MGSTPAPTLYLINTTRTDGDRMEVKTTHYGTDLERLREAAGLAARNAALEAADAARDAACQAAGAAREAACQAADAARDAAYEAACQARLAAYDAAYQARDAARRAEALNEAETGGGA